MTLVLFVCLGNICRSPMAEAIFRKLVKEEGLEQKVHIDSAGIREWHIGKPPHQGTCQILTDRGISFDGIIGRQVTLEDLTRFDWIIVMDQKNLASIEQLAGKKLNHVYLLPHFIADSADVEISDPYHTGDFETCYKLIESGCKGLLEVIRSEEE